MRETTSMQTFWIIFAIFIGGLVGFWAVLLMQFRLYNRRRAALMAAPFSDKSIALLQKNIPLYNRLPEELKRQLHGLLNVFLNEKRFFGCGGLNITDEIKITIAAQACLLLLNRKTNFYPKLKTIYVYPSTYIANHIEHDDGLIVEGKSIRLGESWQNGPVVLAWDSVAGQARNIHDGLNVVLHEFAHQLDQEDGHADGVPMLESRSSYQRWKQILTKEFQRLQASDSRRPVLDEYGAENPAEFFAVATETFFEKPVQLHTYSPQLYDELKNYYKLDPFEWASKKPEKPAD